MDHGKCLVMHIALHMHAYIIFNVWVHVLKGVGPASSRTNAAVQPRFEYASSPYELAYITSSSLFHGHRMFTRVHIPARVCICLCATIRTNSDNAKMRAHNGPLTFTMSGPLVTCNGALDE